MSIDEFDESETGASVPSCDEDLTFSVLTNRARRRLLFALATGGPQTGDDLKEIGKGNGPCKSPGNKLDSTLKNLSLMIEAGIVMQLQNDIDGRRYIYALSPALKVKRSGEDAVIDFGFCVVWLGADGC